MATVLIVEDEEDVRKHLVNLLNRTGHRVIETGTGEEAVKLFGLRKPDITFLDLILPGIDGDEVLRKIRAIDSRAVVYFMTGYTEDISVEAGKAMGANGLLAKPLLFETIKEILDNLK
jgi:CheY-like chemotaxis protein